ncbi:MAG: Ig-like domain-containing protein [Clostridium sp.]|nr:Ig-like domain-containing protein [Clostridium sp.]
MKNRKLHKNLAWLLVFALMLSLVGVGSPLEAMAKSKNTVVLKSVSLKIGNKKVTKKTYKMNRGEKKKVNVSVSSPKAKKKIIFSTSNKKVAAVNQNGSVTAKKAGTAKITVTVSAKKTGENSGTVQKKTWVKIKVTSSSSDRGDDTPEPSAAPTPDRATQEPLSTQSPNVVPAPGISESPETSSMPDISEKKKSIVVYFSCTDNTKTIAEYVAESADAGLYRIEPSVPYTAEDLNYGNSDSRTSKEQNDSLARPEIAGELPSLDGYENVYLGYDGVIIGLN